MGTVLDMAACKSKPHAALSEQKSSQAHSVNSKAPDSPDEKSCRVLAQRFYDCRVSLNVDMFCSNSLKGSRASEEAIKAQEEECRIASLYRNAEKLNLNKVLSQKLLHYQQREDAVQAKDPEDPGLDFDPYLNTQDPSPRFVVDDVRVDGNRCDAIVHGYDEGKQREEVMPELSKAGNSWVIENFHYKIDYNDGKPPQNDDLIHMIREYIREVKQ
ncbi:DUF3828 domain-containing protein [Telmatobacter sp. DSM 110680]|uniref:DUF3828 domain-containing protein n=1 Tax=Telmatobacter sp. DSM 110680 TaxID=3036704 RepID=A0AAU7DL44_9BACT